MSCIFINILIYYEMMMNERRRLHTPTAVFHTGSHLDPLRMCLCIPRVILANVLT